MKLLSFVGLSLFAFSASAQDQCFSIDRAVDFVPARICFESMKADLKPFNFNVKVKGLPFSGNYEVIADSKAPVNGTYQGNLILVNSVDFTSDYTHTTDLRVYLSFDDKGALVDVRKISGEQLVQRDPMYMSSRDKRIPISYTKE